MIAALCELQMGDAGWAGQGTLYEPDGVRSVTGRRMEVLDDGCSDICEENDRAKGLHEGLREWGDVHGKDWRWNARIARAAAAREPTEFKRELASVEGRAGNAWRGELEWPEWTGDGDAFTKLERSAHFLEGDFDVGNAAWFRDGNESMARETELVDGSGDVHRILEEILTRLDLIAGQGRRLATGVLAD